MKPYFTEAIKISEGRFFNLPAHIDRMNHTLQSFFSATFPFSLTEDNIPPEFRKGLVKCRVVYSLNDMAIEYAHYKFRELNRLKIVYDNTIDYTFKYAVRTNFDKLLELRGDADDILIIKNGFVTDTSFSNVVYENAYGLFTPSTFLLAGTKRQSLLNQGIIKEKEIRVENMKEYTKLYVINTMIDIEDNCCISTSDLL